MHPSLFLIRSGTILFLILVSVVIHFGPVFRTEISAAVMAAGTDNLTVAFLDVGQGDAIFIETPDGIQVLIDGGPDGGVVRELSKQLPFFDRTLDVVLATHSDKDHIGGLLEVLSRYEVGTIIRTDNINDTEVAKRFDELQVHEGADVVVAQAGQQLQLGASTTLLILSPEGNPAQWESNTASIVALLEYGESTFMLTGDAPVNIEEYITTNYGSLIESDVLKLGHHGSRTSTSEIFLDTVVPRYAVVSAAKDNSYGHPHREVVEAVTGRNIQLLQTASLGSIVFRSDGTNIWIEQ